MSSGFRGTVEARTGPLLVVLHRAPRWVPFLVVLGLALLGTLLPSPWRGVALLVLAALLGWLLYLGWPRMAPGARLVRLLVAAAVAAVGVSRLTSN